MILHNLFKVPKQRFLCAIALLLIFVSSCRSIKKPDTQDPVSSSALSQTVPPQLAPADTDVVGIYDPKNVRLNIADHWKEQFSGRAFLKCGKNVLFAREGLAFPGSDPKPISLPQPFLIVPGVNEPLRRPFPVLSESSEWTIEGVIPNLDKNQTAYLSVFTDKTDLSVFAACRHDKNEIAISLSWTSPTSADTKYFQLADAFRSIELFATDIPSAFDFAPDAKATKKTPSVQIHNGYDSTVYTLEFDHEDIKQSGVVMVIYPFEEQHKTLIEPAPIFKTKNKTTDCMIKQDGRTPTSRMKNILECIHIEDPKHDTSF